MQGAVEQFVTIFTSMGGLMAERVTDLRDIERRVVAHLVGEPEPGVPTPERAVDPGRRGPRPERHRRARPELVLALVTERGGATSHTAIIARQLGIPCVVGVAGDHGARRRAPSWSSTARPARSSRAPTPTRRARGSRRAAAARGARRLDRPRRDRRRPAASSCSPTSPTARPPQSAGVEPVAGRRACSAPSCASSTARRSRRVEEQADIYGEVLAPYADGRYVVVRTLDAGSDKPIAFATHEGEENPALGVRGLRLSFDNPGLLDRQLDGIAAAAERTGTETWVMAPMVATVAEAADFADKVRARGLKAGVMVEIPSAALLAHRMLEVVDFLSIGTNDLTQYTMAADRMATDLAHLTDPWQPAVLQLIAITAEAGTAGRQAGRRLRRGRRRPAARLGARRDGHHLAVDGRRRRTPGRRAARPGHPRDLRGRRRGRPRRARPDGRPRRRAGAARPLIRPQPRTLSKSSSSRHLTTEERMTSAYDRYRAADLDLPEASLGLEPVRRGRGEHGQGRSTRAGRPSPSPMPTRCWSASTAWASASRT